MSLATVLLFCCVSVKALAETVASPPLSPKNDQRLTMELPSEWPLVERDKENKRSTVSTDGFHFVVRRKVGEIVETCQIAFQVSRKPVGRYSVHGGETLREMDGITVARISPPHEGKPNEWDLWILGLRVPLGASSDLFLSLSFSPCSTEDQLELCRWISEHLDFTTAEKMALDSQSGAIDSRPNVNVSKEAEIFLAYIPMLNAITASDALNTANIPHYVPLLRSFCSIFVKKECYKRALEILRADAKIHHYSIDAG